MKKSLVSTHPELLREWDSSNTITPDEITFGSRRKVFWKCQKCKQVWKARVDKRSAGSGCPVCANQVVVQGVNDLATTHPQLLQDWSSRNSILPTQITAGSKKIVKWDCYYCGRQWETKLFKRGREGQGCYCSRPVTSSLSLEKLYPELLEEWDYVKNKLDPSSVSYGSEKKVFWNCGNCGNNWKAAINNRVRGTGCPKCFSSSPSKLELSLQKFVETVVGDVVVFNDRELIAPLELDIVVPSKKIAIEFNGLYWHSEGFVDRDYHFNKLKRSEEKGYRLIQVWEDDWVHKRPIVERMLENKLGVSKANRVGARRTRVSQVEGKLAKEFLNEHHLQGVGSGSYLGLFSSSSNSDDSLLAVLQYKRRDRETIEIVRFAGINVQGGFGKLLKFLIEEYSPKQVVTFSDNMVSDGGLYRSLGFIEDGVLAPDYSYVVSGKRKHKFSYRKKRFREDPNLLFEEGLTERELAALNRIPRVWDAGKVRWVLAL